MAKTVIEYKCLLISPSDVEDERKEIPQVVSSWNAQIGDVLGTRIELVKWESHSVPEMGDEPQTILNRQLVDNCDFGLAVFWTRLGTPTADYESGSIEEIEKLVERQAKVRIYFSEQPVPYNTDLTQLEKLRDVKEKFKANGLLGKYSDIANLREQIILHLTKTVAELLAKDKGFNSFPAGMSSSDATSLRDKAMMNLMGDYFQSAHLKVGEALDLYQKDSEQRAEIQRLKEQLENLKMEMKRREEVQRNIRSNSSLSIWLNRTIKDNPDYILSANKKEIEVLVKNTFAEEKSPSFLSNAIKLGVVDEKLNLTQRGYRTLLHAAKHLSANTRA